MKANRVQYRKNWAAANGALRHSSAVVPDSNNGHFVNLNPSGDNTDSDTEPEQCEPPQKSARISPQRSCSSFHDNANIADLGENPFISSSSESEDESPQPSCSSLHEDDDVDIGKNQFLGSSSESENEVSFHEKLVDWTNKFSIKQNALDGLLGLLKGNGHPDLPRCARTLLQTSRSVPIQTKSGMDYVYFPLAEQLLRHFKRHPLETIRKTDSLEISLNVDGLPLFKSSAKNLWPVLCAIVNIKPILVFPVVLTCGNSKPKDLEFLEELINELNIILESGLKDGERVLPVSIRCIVCDAPARALVKGTKLCSDYFGCDKCTQKGMWVGRVIYPLINTFEVLHSGGTSSQVKSIL